MTGNITSAPIWFAAGYFGTGQEVNITRNGETANLWESSGIPFIRIFGDSPAYLPDRHRAAFRNSINAYGHPEHLAFYRRWFRDPTLSVLLHPITIDKAPADTLRLPEKASGKIIFPKNGNSPMQLRAYWRDALPSSICQALEDLAEESIGLDWIDREPCLDDRLLDYFGTKGIDLAAELGLLFFLVAQLDDYLRRVKSTMIAEALLDLPVIVRGRNWDHVNFTGRRATYDPSSDMAATLALIDQAPAMLDMSPNTQRAPHDRIWRAMGRRTAFLTNRQEFLDAALGLSASRCSFSFERSAIRTLVEHYVERPQDAIDLGLEQVRTLSPLLDESRYVDSLRTAVQTVAFARGSRPPATQDFVSFPSLLIR
ncbi:MAG: hypothetical protein HZA62_08430 [Rhodocyclales bacterium]|nr:hypothetical protein [Rhodocyclales bacterium]